MLSQNLYLSSFLLFCFPTPSAAAHFLFMASGSLQQNRLGVIFFLAVTLLCLKANYSWPSKKLYLASPISPFPNTHLLGFFFSTFHKHISALATPVWLETSLFNICFSNCWQSSQPCVIIAWLLRPSSALFQYVISWQFISYDLYCCI